MLDSYGIEPKLTIVKNPTANTIHYMLGEQLQATGFGTDWSNGCWRNTPVAFVTDKHTVIDPNRY